MQLEFTSVYLPPGWAPPPAPLPPHRCGLCNNPYSNGRKDCPNNTANPDRLPQPVRRPPVKQDATVNLRDEIKEKLKTMIPATDSYADYDLETLKARLAELEGALSALYKTHSDIEAGANKAGLEFVEQRICEVTEEALQVQAAIDEQAGDRELAHV